MQYSPLIIIVLMCSACSTIKSTILGSDNYPTYFTSCYMWTGEGKDAPEGRQSKVSRYCSIENKNDYAYEDCMKKNDFLKGVCEVDPNKNTTTWVKGKEK